MSKRDQKRFREQMAIVNRNHTIACINRERRDAFTSGLYLIIWVLHTNYGFGWAKIKGLVKDMNALNDDINADLVNPRDIVDVLEEETGIVLKDGKVYTKNE